MSYPWAAGCVSYVFGFACLIWSARFDIDQSVFLFAMFQTLYFMLMGPALCFFASESVSTLRKCSTIHKLAVFCLLVFMWAELLHDGQPSDHYNLQIGSLTMLLILIFLLESRIKEGVPVTVMPAVVTTVTAEPIV